MKIFFTALIITILISGCATRNAFSKLGLTELQEKAIENTVSGKLYLEDIVGGVFSAIYINNISADMDKTKNNFYVSVYLKEQSEDLNITSNTQEPLEIKELDSVNDFSNLLAVKSEWSKNYLISFENDENNNTVNLLIESGQFSSGPLSYSKDQR